MAYNALRSRVFVPICTPSVYHDSQFKTSFLTATLIPPFFPLLLSNICSSYFCSRDCKSLIETSTSVSCPEYRTGFHRTRNQLSCACTDCARCSIYSRSQYISWTIIFEQQTYPFRFVVIYDSWVCIKDSGCEGMVEEVHIVPRASNTIQLWYITAKILI